VIATNGTYSLSFETQILRNGYQNHGNDRRRYSVTVTKVMVATDTYTP